MSIQAEPGLDSDIGGFGNGDYLQKLVLYLTFSQ